MTSSATTASAPLTDVRYASHETKRPRRRAMALLFALCAIALCLRVGAIFALKAWKNPNAMEHRQLARNWVEEGKFFWFRDWEFYGPSSVQSPPYPVLLSSLFYVFGTDSAAAYVGAMIINAIFGALTVYLTYRLARTMGSSESVALIAAALMTVWPTQVYTTTHVQAIIPITAAVVAMIVLFYESVRTGRVWPWIIFSLVSTLGALTEPVLLPPAALTGLIILFWPTLSPRLRIRNAAILLAAAILVIGPWSVRNRVVHGKWVPIKDTFWVNMWKANNPHATGTDRLPLPLERRQYFLREGLFSLSDAKLRDPATDKARQYDKLTPEQQARLRGKNDTEREDIFKELAQTWIGQNKGEYIKLCFIRLGKTLTIDWDNPKSYSIVYIAPKMLLLVVSIIGAVLAIRRRWSLFYPALIIGTALLTYTLTITAARFSIPLEPIQIVLAALVIGWFFERRRKSEHRQPAVA